MNSQVLTLCRSDIGHLYASPRFADSPAELSEFARLLKSNGHWRNRLEAERDDGAIQIVACAVIWHENDIVCLRRSKKSDRPALRHALTVMFGGHVDEADGGHPFPPMNCVRRELEEELGLSAIQSIRIAGMAIDPDTLSGSRHLGVIFDIRIADSDHYLGSHLDFEEFCNNALQQPLPLQTLDYLYSRRAELDPWSRLYLDALADHRNDQRLMDFVWK